MEQIASELSRGTKVKVARDSRERPLHCHHEKVVVVDDEVAFGGGMDLTHFAGDRYDTPDHVARAATGWHDCSSVLRGPIVGDVADHFRFRWQEVAKEPLPPPEPAAAVGDVELQLVRTVPEKIYDSLPRGDFRVLEAYTRSLRSAERLVYIENQFLWSPQIVDLLAEKLSDPPSDDFRLLLVLPSAPTTGKDDTRGQLAVLAEADDGAGRFLACSLYARSGARADPIYVHAKVAVVDDRWVTVGSANLNNHSLFNDSEVNVIACDPELARTTRWRLWSEHLELPLEEVSGDPTVLFEDRWQPIAKEQRARKEAGLPLTHRLVALPHVSKRSKRLLGPLQSLLVDG